MTAAAWGIAAMRNSLPDLERAVVTNFDDTLLRADRSIDDYFDGQGATDPLLRPHRSVGAAFISAVRASGSQPFIRTTNGRAITYESFAGRILHTMRWLASLGLQRG